MRSTQHHSHKLPATKKRRRYSRKLSFVLTDPSGIFIVSGGRKSHFVKVTNVSKHGFIYECEDCQHDMCSHELAIMAHLQPDKFRSAPIKKRENK